MDRVKTTLFMLMSVDGKISTGSADERDVDKDFPKIPVVRDGLQQYYELESHTDILSFNTGRVMAKIGINKRTEPDKKMPVTFVIADNKPHLLENGVKYLCKWTKTLILVTNNKKHPAFKFEKEISNLKVVFYPEQINFQDLFKRLKSEFGFNRMTIQSGGTLNSVLLREGLIDNLSIVVAPALIGGKDTSTLIDGNSLNTEKDLLEVRPLRLKECKKMKNSYINLKYEVINK